MKVTTPDFPAPPRKAMAMQASTFEELAQLPHPDLPNPRAILANQAFTYNGGESGQALAACLDSVFEGTSLATRKFGADVVYTSYGCPRLRPDREFRHVLSLTQASPYLTFAHESDLDAVWMLIATSKSGILGTGIDYLTSERAAMAFEDCTEAELECMFFPSELEGLSKRTEPSYYLGALSSMKEAAFKAISQAYSFKSDREPSIAASFMDVEIDVVEESAGYVRFEARPHHVLGSIAREAGKMRVAGACAPFANGHLSQAYALKQA
jgi:phosphopantetheinyl transferase (holo-ACP synthase)